MNRILVQNNLGPFVAKQDLKIIVPLKKEGNDIFANGGFDDIKIMLNDFNDVAEDILEIHLGEDNCRKWLKSGYISAIIAKKKPNYGSSVDYALGYIPSGTEYYIDIYANSICARKVYISDDTAIKGLSRKDKFNIFSQLLETVSRYEMSAGYLYSKDDRFYRFSKFDYDALLRCEENRDEIKWIVGHVDKGNNSISLFSVNQCFDIAWTYATSCTTKPLQLPPKCIFQDVIMNNITIINAVLTLLNKPIWYGSYWCNENKVFNGGIYCNCANGNIGSKKGDEKLSTIYYKTIKYPLKKIVDNVNHLTYL